MALLFAINPLLYLKSEGRLPLPFHEEVNCGSSRSGDWGQIRSQHSAIARRQRPRGSPRCQSHCLQTGSSEVKTPEFGIVDELTRKVLNSFAHWRKETLDLHELFEAGGNDPEARTAVFDIVERLVKEGLLAEEGNDFYSLTEKGKQPRNKLAA